MKSSFIDTITRVPTRLNTDFFRLWVDFLRPYHELPNKESELLTCILKFRYNLSKEISNEDLWDFGQVAILKDLTLIVMICPITTMKSFPLTNAVTTV